MTRRLAVVCDDGHKRVLVAGFIYIESTDPGLPDELGTWSWKWDNEPAVPKLWADDDDRDGIPSWYGQPKREVTSTAPDGTCRVTLACPRCRRRVVRTWPGWSADLARLSAAGVSSIALRSLALKMNA